MSNVELVGREKVSPFRKLALGTWQTAYDPSIYGTMRLRMDRALAYIESFREKYDKKLTITHLVAKAIGLALADGPDANGLLRYNNIYRRRDIDVSLLVVMEEDGRSDLSSTKIRKIDEKSLVEIVSEVEERVQRIRARQDEELENTRQSMKLIPALFMNFFLKTLSFLVYTLNLNLKWAGIPKDVFGGAIVTSIGSIGLDIGYVPLVPYTRVPIFVAPGLIREELEV